jgi:hypothetical protein
MSEVPAIDDLWRLELAKARQAAGADAAGGAAGGFWPAALLGLAAWARTILATPAGDPLPADAPVLAALHGEISNRTRLPIAALAAEAPRTPILLLGRLQQPLTALRRALAELGLGQAPLVRPFDLAAALGALPAILRRLAEGARVLAAAPWRPAPRELAAICFRMALGETCARWAGAHLPPGARTVLFGHTGVADSHLLERALQAGGARTVHWVHGVSLGVNFIAGSDLGLFQCASDARWHQALGGYGRTASLAAAPPAAPAGDEGWLVLSNLIHPMNADYRAQGVAGEAALLRAVAAAARIAGQRRVTWKPHPVIATLDPAVKAGIEATARELGIIPWPHGPGDLAQAAAYPVIVATPSTVAIDVLRLGRLPLIYRALVPTPGSAVAQFPLQVWAPEEIAAAAGRLSAPAERDALFQAAWTAVGPGRPATLGDILSLAAAGRGG